MKRLLTTCGAIALSGLAATAAFAQSYPFRDITAVVVWGAGGGWVMC